ncbi:MAG: hypothetical protein QXJ63_00845 [Candidatus Bathyarchaeia archaeon]
MAHKAKKTFSSISYSLQKLQRKLSTVKPSSFVLAVAAVTIAVFLFGGGLYSIIMKPYPAVYYGGRFLFIYPQLSEQFWSDSIIAMILYSLGIIGAVFIYQSTKYAYKPRQAYMMFTAGVAFLIVAYVSIEAVMSYWKGV